MSEPEEEDAAKGQGLKANIEPFGSMIDSDGCRFWEPGIRERRCERMKEKSRRACLQKGPGSEGATLCLDYTS
jgi:hypothetical protein